MYVISSPLHNLYSSKYYQTNFSYQKLVYILHSVFLALNQFKLTNIWKVIIIKRLVSWRRGGKLRVSITVKRTWSNYNAVEVCKFRKLNRRKWIIIIFSTLLISINFYVKTQLPFFVIMACPLNKKWLLVILIKEHAAKTILFLFQKVSNTIFK